MNRSVLILLLFFMSGYATFMDSVSLEWFLRKYYISKDLEMNLNDYMAKNGNQVIDSNCSDVYEFTYQNKKDKPSLYCMHSLEEATKYYNSLKKIIETSNGNSIQKKLILIDLMLLINNTGFIFSSKQKEMILRIGNTPKEKEKMQGLVDTMKFLSRQRLQNIQDK